MIIKLISRMYLFRVYRTLLPIIIFLYTIGCDNKREALGADNEIRVICSEVDREIIQQYLSNIFIDTLYTPEPEPYYHLKFSDPITYLDLRSQSQVVVAAVSREPANPGYQLVKRILSPEQFDSTQNQDPIILGKDVYAKKQLFMIINANSSEQLMSTIKEKQGNIRRKFHEQFLDRQGRFLFGDDRNKDLEDSLSMEFGWTLKLPWGWEMIKKSPDSNFIWLGKEMPFQWIGIGWTNGNIVGDDLLVGEYIWNWPVINYGNIQFNEYKFKLDKTFYNNEVAWRAQGIWETIDLKEAKGGPFRSYLIYDSKQNKTYHLNFLIHHPGNDKSIFMRQMDMIVKSFRIDSI